jgi:spermidine synthase
VLLNSLGAALGPLLASFVLLEVVGLWAAVTVLAYGYLAIAAALLIWTTSSPRWLAIAPVAALAVLAIAFPSSRLSSPGAAPGERVRAVWEGSLGTVAVVEEPDNLRLTLNTYYTLGDTRSLGIQRMQAHVPLLLHADPSSVFFLGLGTGISAGAALDHPVTRVVATELVPEVITAAREYFRPYVNGLFTDPRASVTATDGRNYLLGVGERYDVIVADLFTPWYSGTGVLYSLEHFRIARSRLTEGGVFAQWLALYQLSLEEFLIVARTMMEVFPQVTLWRANFEPERPVVALIGTDAGALDAEAFRRRARQSLSPNGELGDELGALAGLLYAGNLTAQSDLFRAYPVNTDNRPFIEFLAPVSQREFLARRTPRLVGQELDKLYERLLREVPPDADPYLAGLRAEERGAVGAGLALYRYRMEKEAGNQSSAARYLDEVYRAVPPALGALVGNPTGPAEPAFPVARGCPASPSSSVAAGS